MWDSARARRLGRLLAAALLFAVAMAFLLAFFRVRVSFATGMVLLAISALMPLRQEEEPWDLWWDTVGWLLSLVIGLVCGLAVREPALDLIRQLDPVVSLHAWLRAAPDAVIVVLALLLIDFLCYWAHRVLHHDRLWSQHAWHHSPRYLTWIAGSRTTVVNYLILTVLPAILVGTFLPMPQSHEALVLILAIPRLADHLHHTNLRLPYPGVWELLIVTPRYHFVHHHRERRYNDTNFGFLFTFWDRVFGTYTDPSTLEPNFPLGLNYPAEPWRLVLGLPCPTSEETPVSQTPT